MKPLYTSDGFFAYRTRLLTYEAADSFGRCLRANSSRFCNVEVHHRATVKGERSWFVTFQPVSSDAMFNISEREQASRIQRADREGENYLYAIDTDSPRPFYRCCNPLSGGVYELDHSGCDCPDFTYRLAKVPGYGVRCKHLIELDRRIAAGELPSLAEVREQLQRRAYGTVEYDAATVAIMAGATA